MGWEEERRRLLAAAMEVVLARGLDVSNRELAAAIGTSHRVLDYYFGGRQGLMSAVLDGLSAELMGLFDSWGSVTAERPPLSSLADVQGYPPELGALWLEVLLRAMRGEQEFAAAVERIGQAWHDWLTEHWGLDPATADSAIAAYEGSGIIAAFRGEAASRQAARRLLSALDQRGERHAR